MDLRANHPRDSPVAPGSEPERPLGALGEEELARAGGNGRSGGPQSPTPSDRWTIGTAAPVAAKA